MNKNAIEIYKIDAFIKKTGLSRRTIHYYLQRGLLMPPVGDGRGSYYTREHLERLREIQKYSAKGIPLSQIKMIFEHGIDVPENVCVQHDPSTPEAWARYPLYPGIEVHIRIDVSAGIGHITGLLNAIKETISRFQT